MPYNHNLSYHLGGDLKSYLNDTEESLIFFPFGNLYEHLFMEQVYKDLILLLLFF